MSRQNLRQKALALLGQREYTRASLKRKLATSGEDEASIDALLDELSARHWQSDQRYAEQWVQTRATRYGGRRLAQDLRQRGVDSETITQALSTVVGDEPQHAQAVWQKKFGAPSATQQERAKQMRYLQARGFSMKVILGVLRGGGDVEDDWSEEAGL